jgi:hypothetical protein
VFATPANAGLPDGSYRLILCDTSSGGYPLLDGNANGAAGGDFVRNFAVNHSVPITPPPTPTPIATPVNGEQLLIDAKVGRPGSSFAVAGSGYSANAQLGITINGVRVGDVRTDQMGGFKLIFDTVSGAAPGAYVVAVSPTQAANEMARSASQQAIVTYTLDPAAALHQAAPNSNATSIKVPASISPLGVWRTYLPLLE